MSKSTKTPRAHLRLIHAMFNELLSEYCRTQSAQGKPETDSDKLLNFIKGHSVEVKTGIPLPLARLQAMATLFDDTARSVWLEKFQISAGVYDYCPKILQPTFEEVALRMDALQNHLENIGTSDAFFTRPWLGGLLRLSANLIGAIDWLAGEAEPVELGAAMATAMANATADFSHRLSPIGDTDNTLAMVDSVNMMASKAEAVLTMLGNTFAEDEDTARPSDDAVFYALRSIGDEIADIKATVSAFHRQMKNQRA